MVGPVAVLGLVGVAAAGDDVHRQAAAAQLVERRQLAGGERRRHEARPMRQQETQPLGDRRGVRPDEEPVGRIREVADQHAVEAGALVDARRFGDTSASNGGPDGGISSDETRGAIQPIISTGIAPPPRLDRLSRLPASFRPSRSRPDRSRRWISPAPRRIRHRSSTA